MTGSGKGRSAIYRYVKQLVSRLPFMRYVASPLDRAVMRLTGGRQTLTGMLTGLNAAGNGEVRVKCRQQTTVGGRPSTGHLTLDT